MKRHKRRIFGTEEMAGLLNQFDSLPPHGGQRGKFIKENRLNWKMMNGWRQHPRVQAAMRNGTAAQPAQTASTQRQRLHVSDFPELNLEGKTDGFKRSFTLRQKADLISQYDALPVGSEERGELLKKYQIYWNMINRWRADCKREGISIPNLKLKLERTMNGHADVFEGLLHHGPHKGGPRPGAGRPRGSHAKPKENTPGQFQSAQDVVDWLTIQIEERQKIREELEQHVGKTRNE